MKFSEDSEIAANYLRQAIPTMVKHGIVPNPLNYTLWYSYYSKKFPRLNEELDHALRYYGTCPSQVSETLFLQNFSQLDNDESDQLESMQQAFSNVVSKLSQSIDDTAKQTTGFSEALKDNLHSLENFDLDDSLKSVVNELSANATAIYDNSENFNGKIASAQTEINILRAELEKTRQEANTDPLTSLYNRRVLESLYNEFIDINVEDNNLSLIIMDIDKFKAFNDTYGHLVGDQILKYVGKLLKKECPELVTPVRFGGEEFALLCPQYCVDMAMDLAENIRLKLAATPFTSKHSDDKIPPVTASFGVSLNKPGDMLNNILERADKALYEAKNAGRNQVKWG